LIKAFRAVPPFRDNFSSRLSAATPLSGGPVRLRRGMAVMGGRKNIFREPGQSTSWRAPERLAEVAASTKGREERLNRAFAEELTALVRDLVRKARARGWSVAIVVDPIDCESLRGTELQRTLLKPRRLLRNLALYECARFKLFRVSGKQCPNCGSWGIESGTAATGVHDAE